MNLVGVGSDMIDWRGVLEIEQGQDGSMLRQQYDSGTGLE